MIQLATPEQRTDDMASKYRKVDPRIWSDEGFDQLDSEGALLALWLITSNSVNRMGIVVATLGEIADKARISDGSFGKAFDTLSVVCDTLSWPYERIGRNTVVVSLPRWFKYNQPNGPKHFAGMLGDLADVPSCDTVSRHFSSLFTHLEPKYHDQARMGIDKVSHTQSIPEAEAEAEAEAESSLSVVSRNGGEGPLPGHELSNTERDQAQAVFDYWQQSGASKKPQKLTAARSKKIRRRLNDPACPWREAIDRLPIPNTEDFTWQPDFDWLIRNDDNAHKLADGNYDRTSGAKVSAGVTYDPNTKFGEGF